MNLKPGDTIGIISQSWCGPQVFPHVYERGIQTLKNMGYTIKEFPFTRVQGTPKERASDIMAAFTDPSVKAIISTIGGDDCTFTLEHLDIETIKQNAKPIMGYSDPSALFIYFSQHGIPCYHGPAIMAGFAHMNLIPEWESYVKQVLSGSYPPIKPFSQYANNYSDWSKGNISYDEIVAHDGFHYINQLTGEGKLFGGCIEIFEFLKGTPYFPPTEFFDDTILFLETSEDKPSVTQVKYMLRNYGWSGILQRLNGILFGRARDYSLAEKKELEDIILSVLDEFDVSIPVVTNIDFGHTDPQLILPYGKRVRINKDSIEWIN